MLHMITLKSCEMKSDAQGQKKSMERLCKQLFLKIPDLQGSLMCRGQEIALQKLLDLIGSVLPCHYFC